MHHRSLVFALFAGALLALSLRAPQEDPPETELEREMLVVEEGVKRLRRSLRDAAKTPDSLATLASVQAAALAAKARVPVMAARVPEAERAAFVADYRREMVAFLHELLTLEVALLDGDEAEVQAVFKRVRGMEDSGHERFTEDG